MDKQKRKWLPIASGLAAFAVVFMLFVDVVTMEFNGNKAALSGMDVMFGYEEKYGGTSYQFFGFSFMNVLTLLIGVAGIVFVCLAASKKAKEWYKYVALGCFAVSGVLCFCMSSFVVQGKGMEKFYEDFFNYTEETNKLACEIMMGCLEIDFGAILSGIALIVAAGVCLLEIIYAKKEVQTEAVASVEGQEMQPVASVAEETAVAAEPAQEETEEKTE